MARKLSTAVVAMAATTGAAWAGGIERSNQSVGILFEEGTYAEIGLQSVDPKVSGVFGGSIDSGDMAKGYTNYSLGYKRDIGENMGFALIIDNPIGAGVAYPDDPSAAAFPGGTDYPFSGATATIKSNAVTGLLRYKLPNNFSVYGGLRAQTVKADLSLPSGGGPYALTVPSETDYGYVLGAAYEKPEIALRVALTYNSEITHNLTDNTGNNFDVEIPKSWHLEFQTGVAQNTLAFGGIKWREWTKFNISPPEYPANPLADGKTDVYTYTLGVAQRFNENWSGAFVINHEESANVAVGNLAPTDGYTSYSLAAIYTMDNVKLTGAVTYGEIGDATTTSIGSDFSGNDFVGLSLKLGFTF